jgi:hypothetical protein
MAEDGIPEILAEQRLGHEVPGMRGLYAHASERMRDELKHALQARWEESLIARAAIETHSPVPLLDEFLAPFRDPGHQKSEPAAPRETNKQPTTRGDMEKMISQIPPKHTESLSHGSRLRLKERASDQVKDRIQRVDLITSYSKRRDLADALVSAVQQLRQAQGPRWTSGAKHALRPESSPVEGRAPTEQGRRGADPCCLRCRHAETGAGRALRHQREQREAAHPAARGVQVPERGYEAHAGEAPSGPTTVPTGLAMFAGDFQSIRRFADRDHANIVSWHSYGTAPAAGTQTDAAGHYAPHEATDVLVADIREFSPRSAERSAG